METAVLGCAFYDNVWKKVNFFIRSIKKNSPDTRIFLLTNLLTNFDKKMLTSFDVEFIQIKNISFCKKEIFSNFKHFIFCKRYELYQEFFNKIDQPYVLLSDTRDVIVLKNINNLIETNCSLLLSQEDFFSSFATEPINKSWFLRSYGREKLNHVLNKKIFCSGLTFGSNCEIKKYINMMVNEIKNFDISLIKKVGDQAIHNYLAHNDFISFKISDATCGSIRSIGLVSDEHLNESLNNYGDPIVIHQYNRHLNNFYIKKYINSIFKNFI